MVSTTRHTLRLNKAYVFLQYFFLKFLNFSSSLTLKSPGKSILTLKFCFFISVWSHVCPAAQIYIHSFSKHSLNNYSMWHPGFLGVAHGCIKYYSCEFVVWKQEVVVNMLKNQVDMNFTAAQATCLRVHRKMDSETEGLGNQGVSQRAEFPEPDNRLQNFTRGECSKNKAGNWEVGWLERRLALGLVRGWLGWMGLKQTQRYVYQTEQMLGSSFGKQQLHSHVFLWAFSQQGCQRTQPASGSCSNSHCQSMISALHRIQASLA